VSVLGRHYTHGHVIDFVAQLVDHPELLHILGDGQQRKSYLEVGDCVRAIACQARDRSPSNSASGATP